jgi:predicted nucleic acid-binding protein
MPAKVIDASVLAAWLFGEERKNEAALVKDTDLYAPPLLAYELTNIARKKVIIYPEQTNELGEALKMGLKLPVHWISPDYLSVLRLAVKTGLTAYDASYLFLALTLGIPLITFDEKLMQAAKSYKEKQ